MSKELWDNASEKCEQKARSMDRKTFVDKVAGALADFMFKEGESALRLLRATKKWVLLASHEENGFETAYLLNENGLIRTHTGSGMGAAYASESKTTFEVMVPYTMAEAITSQSGQNSPEKIIPFIRSQLDAIAKEVMEHQ